MVTKQEIRIFLETIEDFEYDKKGKSTFFIFLQSLIGDGYTIAICRSDKTDIIRSITDLDHLENFRKNIGIL